MKELHRPEPLIETSIAGGWRPAQLAKAQTTLEKAQERLKYANNDYGRLGTLYQADLISRKQFEEAEEQEAVRQKELAEARAELRTVAADDLTETELCRTGRSPGVR